MFCVRNYSLLSCCIILQSFLINEWKRDYIWNYGLDSRASGNFYEWRPWFVKKFLGKFCIFELGYSGIDIVMMFVGWVILNIIEHSPLKQNRRPNPHRPNWQTSPLSHKSPHWCKMEKCKFYWIASFLLSPFPLSFTICIGGKWGDF